VPLTVVEVSAAWLATAMLSTVLPDSAGRSMWNCLVIETVAFRPIVPFVNSVPTLVNGCRSDNTNE